MLMLFDNIFNIPQVGILFIFIKQIQFNKTILITKIKFETGL